MIPACAAIQRAMSQFAICTQTSEGAVIATHCVYPSFDPVNVYVRRDGNGFIVSDGGEAVGVAWDHGRDNQMAARCLAEAATRFGITFSLRAFECRVPSEDWLQGAVLAVANAASWGTQNAIDHIARAALDILRDEMRLALDRAFHARQIDVKPERVGDSGAHHVFDFAVTIGERRAFVSAMTPHPASINAKYTACSDVARRHHRPGLFIVHNQPLNDQTFSLFRPVANVVTFERMIPGLERELQVA